MPQVGYVTGDLDIHDLAVDGSSAEGSGAPAGGGRLVFVNTLFSCLATVSEKQSFLPLWRPPFVSKLAAEDRCHLNGLAMRGGKPAWVTAVSESDVADGWREGPKLDKGERWQPDEVGAAVADLLKKAVPAQKVYGT